MEKIPNSVEDFVKSDWKKVVYKTIYRFRLDEDTEVLFNDIVFQMYITDYLSKYISGLGSFYTYIYVFTRNFLIKVKNRQSRVIPMEVSTIEGYLIPKEYFFEKNMVFRSLFKDAVLAVDKKSTGSSYSKVTLNSVDTYIAKDSLNIFLLIVEGYSKSEVADILNTSCSNVSRFIMDILSIFEVKVFGRYLSENIDCVNSNDIYGAL